jgi:hypothetical protein
MNTKYITADKSVRVYSKDQVTEGQQVCDWDWCLHRTGKTRKRKQYIPSECILTLTFINFSFTYFFLVSLLLRFV